MEKLFVYMFPILAQAPLVIFETPSDLPCHHLRGADYEEVSTYKIIIRLEKYLGKEEAIRK